MAKKSPSLPAYTEHQIQSMLVAWAKLKEARIPQLASLFAVPNGANKSVGVRMQMKREGLKPGVPDLVLPVMKLPYGSLYIEMKRPGAYPNAEQREWADRLEGQGMKVVRRCTSWQDGAVAILEYLDIDLGAFPELVP
jgi:hypothetical protein